MGEALVMTALASAHVLIITMVSRVRKKWRTRLQIINTSPVLEMLVGKTIVTATQASGPVFMGVVQCVVKQPASTNSKQTGP
jgi:hypothetical protein